MLLIFTSIAFVYLCTRFYTLAADIDWCMEKIIASAFILFAIPSFFLFVIVENVAFHLLPIAFALVAIDTLSAKSQSDMVG